MAEYNLKYQELKRSLRILKLLNRIDPKDDDIRNKRDAEIDKLLKELDHRYSENLFLDEIETSVKVLEDTKY